MGKKAKNIGYDRDFDYKKEQSDYSFQIKKKRNWLWWLLLLLLLPLLRFSKCEREEQEEEVVEPVIVHVIDRDTEDDIVGASVEWSIQPSSAIDSGITNYDGCKTLDSVLQNEHSMLTITARAEGYADTTYTRVRIPADMERNGMVEIKMRPLSVDFHADIVMCIDNTGSMKSLLNMVKKNALNFHTDLKNYCAKQGQSINDIRVRIISFGDFDDSRYTESGLLEIPAQKKKFQQFIDDIDLTYGGDEPEDGFEALALAMNTPWDKQATRRRHIILVYTDAPAHPLGTRATSSFYPINMPGNMTELTKLWNSMDCKARRLVLFAPDNDSWNYLSEEWENVIHEKEELSRVLSGKGYDKILEVISKSL